MNRIVNRMKKQASSVTYVATSNIEIKSMSTDGDNNFKQDTISKKEFNRLLDYLQNDMNELGSKGLAKYSDDRIKEDVIESIIVSAKFNNGSPIAETTIVCSRELTKEELEELESYITGQYSDGWGEGFEQNPFYSYEDEYQNEEFDEETQEYNMETLTETIEEFAYFSNNNMQFKITRV